jgi:uncharacterized protein
MIKKLLPEKSFSPLRLLSLVLVLIGISIALSCTRISKEDAKKASDDPNTGTAALNQPVQPAPKPVMPLTDMPFEQLVNATSGLLDDFWRQSFKDMRWQATYNTPKSIVPYSEPFQSACGMITMNNAFYCPADQKIYFDDNLLRSLYQDPGDYAAVTVFAHEWGHSVQRDLGIIGGDKQYFTIQTELQADCFAGAFAKHIYELGYLEEGDLDEGGEALLKFGDPRNGKWFDPQAHGKPFQRGAYFNKGWEGGLPNCMGKE